MNAKEFKHQTVVFAENQPEYTPLPALKLNTKEGEVIFCMGLSFIERIRVLFLGKIWVSLMMFGRPLTPSFHSTRRKDVYSIFVDRLSKKEKLILFIDLGAILYFNQ